MAAAHSIADALKQVQTRIADAALRAGRAPADVRLVAVSKTYPVAAIQEALAAGQHDFGENRIEEALAKQAALAAHSSTLHWHLIGHVQSRKARDAAGRFDLIHSVDTAKLAEGLDRRMASLSADAPRQIQPILLECNVSGEASKSGFDVANWEHEPAKRAAFIEAVKSLWALPHLRIDGLMTMAPIVETPEQARPVFASLRALREVLREALPSSEAVILPHLSMGMSDDFEAAVAEGSTLVRVGRAIFGERGTQ